MRKTAIIFGIIGAMTLSGCSVSLAADVTPPPEYQTPTQKQPVTQEISAPIVPPDPENGKTIYDEKCSACHGESGMGDGEQASQLPNPVAALGDPNLAKEAIPMDWYRMVTNGNLDTFMPGFASLSDRERWDVTAYALSFSLDKNAVEQGQELFIEYCQQCHVDGQAPDLSDQNYSVEHSLNDIYEVIANGKGDDMPAFNETLSESALWSLASYTRTLGFTGNVMDEIPAVQEPPNAAAEEPSEPAVDNNSIQPDNFSISGSLLNLDQIDIDQISGNLIVFLRGFDGMAQVVEEETKVSADGEYQFENLEYVEGRVYQLTTSVNGIQYSSEVLHNPDVNEEGFVNLPIVIRPTTTDASNLFAERMHLFFDVTPENKLQVVELFVINNPTDEVIVPAGPESPIIAYHLPANAENLQFEQENFGERYLMMENGFGDLMPIEANQSFQFLFAYELPYSKNLDLEISIPFDVEASIVMVPGGSMKVESDLLQYAGERDMQGMQIQTYTTGRLTKDSTIEMTLSNKLDTSALMETSTTGLIIGGLFFVTALGFGVVWFRKRSQNSEDNDLSEEAEEEEFSIEYYLDAVIALDESYNRGEIPEDAYQNRRESLIDKIKEIRGDSSSL